MSYTTLQRHSVALTAIIAIGALALAPSQSAVAATTLTWPNLVGFGHCLGSLQACVDEAAPGDVVQIGVDDLFIRDRYTTINEDIAINKSLTLRAASGIDAVFVAGRGITINPPNVAALSYSIAVEGLILDRGSIDIQDLEITNSTFRVEGVRFNDVPANQVAINMYSGFFTSSNFQVFRNVIRVRPNAGPFTEAIDINSSGSAMAVTVSENRIEAPDGGLFRALAISDGAAGPVNVSNNTIVGRDVTVGMRIDQGPDSGAENIAIINNSVSAQAPPNTGFVAGGMIITLSHADAQVVNNTIVSNDYGLYFTAVAAAAPSVTGLVANNLIALNSGPGIAFESGYAGVTNRKNLLFGNGPDVGFVPGPGTLTSDPLLYSPTYPRPSDASPAINSGSNSALPVLDLFDADGQPRVMLATVDIGAYEAGFAATGVHTATASDIQFNWTVVSAVEGFPLIPSDELVVTPLHTAGAATGLAQNLGVYMLSPLGPLAIFHEAITVDMTNGRRFAVTVPGFGLLGYTHTTTAANVVNQYTTLSDGRLNGQPGVIAVVTHNWLLSGPYHDHPIGLEYFGGLWYLRNEDTSDMLSGRNFNVVIAPALSENAFRVSTANTASEIEIIHPLLDDNACAAPIVGRVNTPGPVVSDATAFSLDYRPGAAGPGAPGRWFVLAEGGGAPASFPAGAAFNVIIDGAQANRCRDSDRIFANGLE